MITRCRHDIFVNFYSFLFLFEPINFLGTFPFLGSHLDTQHILGPVKSHTRRSPSDVTSLKIFCSRKFSQLYQSLPRVHWLLKVLQTMIESVYQIVSLQVFKIYWQPRSVVLGYFAILQVSEIYKLQYCKIFWWGFSNFDENRNTFKSGNSNTLSFSYCVFWNVLSSFGNTD